MGQRPRKLSPELSARHKFGAELRLYRTKSGLSMARLGRKVYFSADTIGRVERGERNPSERLVRACDNVLNGGGALIELWAKTQAARPRTCRHCGSVLGQERPVTPPTEDRHSVG
jgi:transcriptional regulator with XRE-family HTH domain